MTGIRDQKKTCRPRTDGDPSPRVRAAKDSYRRRHGLNWIPVCAGMTFLFASVASPAFADCTSPAGLKGEIVYNDDYDTMQFCDNSNWVSMSASGTAVESDPQVDTLTASKWCKANAGGTAIDCTFTTVDATAAGSTGYVQFHTAGTLDAEDVFIWDKTNNRLGIGSTAPAQTLDVVGTFALTGAATFASTLGVTGNFAVNTNKFTVAAASGNTAVAGMLGVTGPATLSSTLAVTGAATMSSTLGVTGAVTAASFSGDGSALTALNASNLGSGTVPTVRLGSGTASSSTYLRGDSSWVDITSLIPTPGGSTGHVQFNNAGVFAGSASFFWDNSNSRLGIGTASPAYPLEVAGKAKSVTMLLTPGSGSAPTGTGSATYWNQAGSDLYFMTGNVGIGTATPAVKLDVVGALTVSGNGSIGGTLNSIGNFSVATSKFTVAAATGNTTVAGTLDVSSTVTANAFSGPGIVPAHAVMAFNLTTCPTGWSEYTPARGRFVRGIDNGAGNDPDGTRAAGATQADAFASHTHAGSGAGSGEFVYYRGSGQGVWQYGTLGAADFDRTSSPVASTGGAETRPKNVALLYCEKN